MGAVAMTGASRRVYGRAGRRLDLRRMTLGTAAVLGALALAACGGGGAPGPAPLTVPGPMLPEDGAGPEGVLGRAGTLLATGAHFRWTLTDGETDLGETGTEPMTCTGARCVDADGMVTALSDLRSAFAGPGAAGTQTGTRGGLDTIMTANAFETTHRVAGVAVTAGPATTAWGVWGEHGAALLVLGAGPLSAVIEGGTFTGTFSQGQAWALGAASGSNPAGTGRATWRGVAEAASTAAYARLAGTAVVTIADLSRPRVGVAIHVPGHTIGAPGWADMALVNGRFSTGTAGADSLAGDFHGPGHEEAWGVFDTGAYVGAFGAKRTP